VSHPLDDLPRTLGDLERLGWEPRSVRDEVRANVLERVRRGQPVVDGMVGYEDSVLPELARALVSGHDVILLGERGQGKTRILRSLVALLDPLVPAIAGSPLNEDPFAPVLAETAERVRSEGASTPVEWIPRHRRYSEKLATPDTTIADLIGEVDPIKVAEGRTLDDPAVLTFGLVPRANRGLFAVNELPDLPERIQVGLLNALEERDVQVRGFAIRLPLDVLFLASANPEDYTARGRLITPLKDRFGTQLRTHYPSTIEDEIAIMRQEAVLPESSIVIGDVLDEVVAHLAQLARRHPAVSRYSGVSVRGSIAAREAIAAAALIRAVRLSEHPPRARLLDAEAAIAAFAGKIEVEAHDTTERELATQLLSQAIVRVFAEHLGHLDPGAVIEETTARPLTVDMDASAESWNNVLADRPALRALVSDAGANDPAIVAELCLEGLVATRRLGKQAVGKRATYGR
jgi:magnesium chelatase subunit I